MVDGKGQRRVEPSPPALDFPPPTGGPAGWPAASRVLPRRASLLGRRRYFLTLPLVVVALLVALGVPALTPRHTAVSALLAAPADGAIAPPAAASHAVAELLRSDQTLARVIDVLGLSAKAFAPVRVGALPPLQLPGWETGRAESGDMLERMRRKVRVNERDGGVLVLACDDADPTTAVRVNQALVDVLLAKLRPDPLGEAARSAVTATVLQPARLSSRAVRVDAIRFVLLGGALVLGAGIAGALLAEAASPGFDSLAGVQAATGLEVVGGLPRLGSGFGWDRKRRRLRRLGRVAFALLLAALALAFFLGWEHNARRDLVQVAVPMRGIHSGGSDAP